MRCAEVREDTCAPRGKVMEAPLITTTRSADSHQRRGESTAAHGSAN